MAVLPEAGRLCIEEDPVVAPTASVAQATHLRRSLAAVTKPIVVVDGVR